MGVSGGAIFSPIQGAIADEQNTKVSFVLVVPAFVYIPLASVAFNLLWFRADPHSCKLYPRSSCMGKKR
jgi:fucose permease